MSLTIPTLKQITPSGDNALIAAIVLHQDILAVNGINTRNRLAYFLGQAACETQGFTRLEENLYYTSVARLRQVWPRRFTDDRIAAACVRNPRNLANHVYGGRLGNLAPDDGWKYRGSGILQTTGRGNFAVVATDAKIDCLVNPDTLRSMPDALTAAAVYWRINNLNQYADKGDIVALTRKINGGENGLTDRRLYTDRALRALIDDQSLLIDFFKMQEILRRLKYYDGAIDGIVGPETKSAIADFQRDHGLIADGICGKRTWGVLNAVD